MAHRQPYSNCYITSMTPITSLPGSNHNLKLHHTRAYHRHQYQQLSPLLLGQQVFEFMDLVELVSITQLSVYFHLVGH